MEKEQHHPEHPPEPTLSGLALSLAAAALAYMGHAPVPGAEKAKPEPVLARHTIDTIGMLKEKTEGNRTDDESKLLDGLLQQLRLAYVKLEQVAGQQSGEDSTTGGESAGDGDAGSGTAEAGDDKAGD